MAKDAARGRAHDVLLPEDETDSERASRLLDPRLDEQGRVRENDPRSESRDPDSQFAADPALVDNPTRHVVLRELAAEVDMRELEARRVAGLAFDPTLPGNERSELEVEDVVAPPGQRAG